MSGKHWSIIAGTVSYVQRYCGLEKRQVTLALSVGGLDGSLPQIFSCLKNLGIPSAFSDFTLVFFSLCPQSQMHIKRFIPAMKLNELYWREKNQNLKFKCYANKKNEYQTIF